MIDLSSLSISKVHNDLSSGVYTCRDLALAYLDSIKEKNDNLFAYLEVYDDVLEQADIADKMFKEGRAGLLTGIPIAIKDNMLFRDRICSAGSKILENYKATYSAHAVSKLKEQGVVFLGRTNMDEFAMGSSTENSAYGITKNPINPDFVPGGSSGGSAVAVAGDMALVTLGSDTGGSIRQPASFCGIVGLKPTYGQVSRSGLIAMSSSLDQIGPFGKSVSDVEAIFDCIKGEDPLDSTTYAEVNKKKKDGNGKVIGIPRDFLKSEGVDPSVLENFEKSCLKLEEKGYTFIDISLPMIKYSLAIYYILMPAEVSSNLARLDGIRFGKSLSEELLLDVYKKSREEGFGKEVKRRILLGTYILSHGYYDAYYTKALKLKEVILEELKQTFMKVDAIATPTSPFSPFKIGEKTSDPLAMYLSDLFTVPANISGCPAISLPSGFNEEGLPHGFHLMAPWFSEDILFSIGKDFE